MHYDTLATQLASDTAIPAANRFKVHIHCRSCGETFVLRGGRNGDGQVETGFKRCICGDEEHIDFEPLA